jgi:hypothetical protein
MKKLFTSLTIFFIVLAISGCVDLKTKIKVNRDGSGTVEETLLMSTEMIQMLKQFMSGFAGDSTNAEGFKLYNEEEMKKRASDYGEDVEFLSGKELLQDGREGYTAIYSFKDLNKLKFDQNPGSKIPEEIEGTEEEHKEYITFRFDKNNGSEIIITMPPASQEKEDIDSTKEAYSADSDSLDAADLSKLKLLFKDFDISLVVETDGEITETNANYADRSSITLFDLNFNLLLDNSEKLKELKKINPNNIQELKEIIKDVAGIKIETNNPVKIKFE